MDNTKFLIQAKDEYDNGIINEAIHLKAQIIANGDENNTRLQYIDLRATELQKSKTNKTPKSKGDFADKFIPTKHSPSDPLNDFKNKNNILIQRNTRRSCSKLLIKLENLLSQYPMLETDKEFIKLRNGCILVANEEPEPTFQGDLARFYQPCRQTQKEINKKVASIIIGVISFIFIFYRLIELPKEISMKGTNTYIEAMEDIEGSVGEGLIFGEKAQDIFGVDRKGNLTYEMNNIGANILQYLSTIVPSNDEEESLLLKAQDNDLKFICDLAFYYRDKGNLLRAKDLLELLAKNGWDSLKDKKIQIVAQSTLDSVRSDYCSSNNLAFKKNMKIAERNLQSNIALDTYEKAKISIINNNFQKAYIELLHSGVIHQNFAACLKLIELSINGQFDDKKDIETLTGNLAIAKAVYKYCFYFGNSSLPQDQIFKPHDMSSYIESNINYKLKVINGFDVEGPWDKSISLNNRKYASCYWRFKDSVKLASEMLWQLVEAHRENPFSADDHYKSTIQMKNSK